MSVLLSMYKLVPKDQRDKATLLQAEAKLRNELSNAAAEIAALQTSNSELSRRLHQIQKLQLHSSSKAAATVPVVKKEDVSGASAEGVEVDDGKKAVSNETLSAEGASSAVGGGE